MQKTNHNRNRARAIAAVIVFILAISTLIVIAKIALSRDVTVNPAAQFRQIMKTY